MGDEKDGDDNVDQVGGGGGRDLGSKSKRAGDNELESRLLPLVSN